MRAKQDSVDLLNAVRGFYTLRELSRILGIKESMLSRYSSGQISPSYERAKLILEKLLSREFLRDFMKRGLEKEGWCLSRLLVRPDFLKLMSLYMYFEILDLIAGSRLDVVITFTDESSLLASLLSTRLDVRVAFLGNGGNGGLFKISLKKAVKVSKPISVVVCAVYDSVKGALLRGAIDEGIEVRAILTVLLMDPLTLRDLAGVKVIKVLP